MWHFLVEAKHHLLLTKSILRRFIKVWNLDFKQVLVLPSCFERCLQWNSGGASLFIRISLTRSAALLACLFWECTRVRRFVINCVTISSPEHLWSELLTVILDDAFEFELVSFATFLSRSYIDSLINLLWKSLATFTIRWFGIVTLHLWRRCCIVRFCIIRLRQKESSLKQVAFVGSDTFQELCLLRFN